jgi:hypothetical protein
VAHWASSAQLKNVNTTGVEMTEDEKNQAAAYIKLHEDVKQIVKRALIDILTTYDNDVVIRIQDVTLGNPSFDIRVRQVITNQMQR